MVAAGGGRQVPVRNRPGQPARPPPWETPAAALEHEAHSPQKQHLPLDVHSLTVPLRQMLQNTGRISTQGETSSSKPHRTIPKSAPLAAPSPAPESKEQPAGAAPALKVQLPKSTRSAASSAAPAVAKTPNRAPEDGGTFKLTATRPSKQRTGGKKAFRCAIL